MNNLPVANAQFRRTLLHILLFCLAGAAASGVLTVMISDRNIMWRVTAMGFVGVAAVGLMIRCSVLSDRRGFREAGLVGMVLCVFAFLLSTGLIWSGLGGWRLEERFGMSLLLTVLMGPAVVALLCLRIVAGGRVASYVGFAAAAVSTVLFLTAVWLDFLLPRNDRIAESAGAIVCAGICLTLCLIGVGGDRRHWRWLGVAGASAGLAMWLYGIWVIRAGEPAWVVCAYSVGAVAAFANVMVRANVTGTQRWVVYGTIAAGAAVALFVDLEELIDPGSDDPMGFQRFTAGATIVTVSGTLATVILSLLNRRASRRDLFEPNAPGLPGESAPLPRTISLQCPRCQHQQTLPLGESSCERCRLIIKTAVEVPVCTGCGYDLSSSPGKQCPECGVPVGARG